MLKAAYCKSLSLWMLAVLFVLTVIAGCDNDTGKNEKPALKPVQSIITNAPVISIKLGVVLPYSGPFAGYGEEGRQGINLAVTEAREQFGERVHIKVLYEDSKGEGADAVRAFRKLADTDKINAVIGEVLSSNT